MACLAMLLSSLAPSIAHALASHTPAPPPWAEICTAHGLTTIAAQGGKQTPDQKQPHQHMSDCPWCRVHADLPALPPSDPAPPLVLDGMPSYPSLFYQAPRPLFAWTAAQPRAPPVFL